MCAILTKHLDAKHNCLSITKKSRSMMLSHLKFKRNLGNCCYDNGVAMQIIDIFPLLSAFYA